MQSFIANWLLPIASIIFAVLLSVWAVQNGNPNAVWLWCDMLNFCGDVP